MSRSTIVVLDGVSKRRMALYRAAAQVASAIPIATLDDLGYIWPEDAWFFVPDDPAALGALQRSMAARAAFNPVVVYSEAPVTSRAIAAIHAGAMNYLAWPCEPEALLAAITGAAELARRRTERAGAALAARAQLAKLSPRELEVLTAMRHGLSNKEIAKELEISPRTVEIHRSKALAKIDARNTIAAVSLMIAAEQLEDMVEVCEPARAA